MKKWVLLLITVTAIIGEKLPISYEEVLVIPSNPEKGTHILSKYGRTRMYKDYPALVIVSIPQDWRTLDKFSKVVKEMWDSGDVVGITYVRKQGSAKIYQSPFVGVIGMSFGAMKKAYTDKIKGMRLVIESNGDRMILGYNEELVNLHDKKVSTKVAKELGTEKLTILALP